jgi:hypothetical protein
LRNEITLEELELLDDGGARGGARGKVRQERPCGGDRVPVGNRSAGLLRAAVQRADFPTSDGRRVMVVAPTNRQWNALVVHEDPRCSAGNEMWEEVEHPASAGT